MAEAIALTVTAGGGEETSSPASESGSAPSSQSSQADAS